MKGLTTKDFRRFFREGENEEIIIDGKINVWMATTTNRGQGVSKDSVGKDLTENKPARSKYFCLIRKHEYYQTHKGIKLQNTAIYLFGMILIYFKTKMIGYA